VRVHQNIVIDGKDYGDKKSRRGSKFCNEGKWETFIAPLLPQDCSELTFVEMGCNAGLFLKMAKERGFKKVIGVERDPNAVEMAFQYRKRNGLDYEIINAGLEEDYRFDFNRLPVADVTVLSNFHYWIFMPVFIHYLNAIRRKTRQIIVVSALGRTGIHFPNTDHESINKYFKLWKEVGVVPIPSKEGDPHPRDMFSVLYESELERRPVDEIIKALGGRGTRHYKRAKRGVETKKFFLNYPLLLLPNGRMIDGAHRLATLIQEGYKTALIEWAE